MHFTESLHLCIYMASCFWWFYIVYGSHFVNPAFAVLHCTCLTHCRSVLSLFLHCIWPRSKKSCCRCLYITRCCQIVESCFYCLQESTCISYIWSIKYVSSKGKDASTKIIRRRIWGKWGLKRVEKTMLNCRAPMWLFFHILGTLKIYIVIYKKINHKL